LAGFPEMTDEDPNGTPLGVLGIVSVWVDLKKRFAVVLTKNSIVLSAELVTF
jgi:hypothetical protein